MPLVGGLIPTYQPEAGYSTETVVVTVLLVTLVLLVVGVMIWLLRARVISLRLLSSSMSASSAGATLAESAQLIGTPRRAVERDAEVPAVEREQFVVGRDRMLCALPVRGGDEGSSGDRDPSGRRCQ